MMQGAAAGDQGPGIEGQAAATTDPRAETGKQGLAALDAKAKANYRLRLADLHDELQDAEYTNDLGRAERARVETEFISRELAAAVGLGGRDRPTGSAAERARLAVTKCIKAAIAKTRAAHPAAGRYLARTIRTGYFCAYEPDADDRTSWVF